MKVGMLFPFAGELVTSGAFVREVAATAEAAGVESLWTVEHVVVADDYEPNYPYSPDGLMPSGRGVVVPIPDPLDTLAFAAAASERILLGTAVVVAPLHSPAVLAKRAATIHALSGGRLLLGLGIGWQKEEYAAVGVPFGDRGRRLDECIEAMRALWADHPASYAGRYVAFERVDLTITPPDGRVPVVLGGNTDAAIGRAARLGDGWFPYAIGPDEFAAGVEKLRTMLREAGRPDDAVEITVWPGSADFSRELEAGWVRAFVDAGASRLVITPRVRSAEQLGSLHDQIARYEDEVLATL